MRLIRRSGSGILQMMLEMECVEQLEDIVEFFHYNHHANTQIYRIEDLCRTLNKAFKFFWMLSALKDNKQGNKEKSNNQVG